MNLMVESVNIHTLPQSQNMCPTMKLSNVCHQRFRKTRLPPLPPAFNGGSGTTDLRISWTKFQYQQNSKTTATTTTRTRTRTRTRKRTTTTTTTTTTEKHPPASFFSGGRINSCLNPLALEFGTLWGDVFL